MTYGRSSAGSSSSGSSRRQLLENVLCRGLLVVLHPLQRREREALAREHHEPDADADGHLHRLQDEPVREAGAVGDAVLRERQRDRGLEQPHVAGPEREQRRDVHQEQDERSRGQRHVQRERLRDGPDGEELKGPPDGLEEDRRDGGTGRAEHCEPLPRHRQQPARSSLALRRDAIGAPGRQDRDREHPDPDEPDDHDARDRPVGQLRGRHHVGDEERDREEVEEAVREHRSEERRARSLAVREVTAEHGDACELARAGGEHRVPEQPDAERREDLPERRARRRHRLMDRQVPCPRARDHREQVEQDPDDHPAPADEVEGVVDRVPVRPAPPDCEDRQDECGEHEQPARPRVPGEYDDPAHAAATSGRRDGAPAVTRS